MFNLYSTWLNRNSQTHKEFETKQQCYEQIERNAQNHNFLSARIQDDDYKVNELWVHMEYGNVYLDGVRRNKTIAEACEEAKNTVFVYYTYPSIINACVYYKIKTITKSGRRINRTALEIKLIKAIVRENTGIIIHDIFAY